MSPASWCSRASLSVLTPGFRVKPFRSSGRLLGGGALADPMDRRGVVQQLHYIPVGNFLFEPSGPRGRAFTAAPRCMWQATGPGVSTSSPKVPGTTIRLVRTHLVSEEEHA